LLDNGGVFDISGSVRLDIDSGPCVKSESHKEFPSASSVSLTDDTAWKEEEGGRWTDTSEGADIRGWVSVPS
jgi:hypothetical protein